MSTWTKGRVYTRSLDVLRGDGQPARYGYIEIRDDICDGWEWTLNDGPIERVWGVCDTLAKAKRAAMAAARRDGWLP